MPLSLAEHSFNVIPHEPLFVQYFCAVFCVEAARHGVGGVYVYTHAQSSLLHEPFGEEANKLAGYSSSPPLGDYVDPLQFAGAAVAAREVSGDVAHDGIVVQRYVTHAREQRVLRMMLSR